MFLFPLNAITPIGSVPMWVNLHTREAFSSSTSTGEPAKLEPLPRYFLLFPQSYFGLDVRSKQRFQSLVPPLNPSNTDILVPKFHTFLEGLVAFNLNPPIPHETPHVKGWLMNEIFIGY